MSEEKYVSTSSVFDMVSKLQRLFFYAILFVIPWFVIPLPYDSTEKLKSIAFISLSCLIILLEIIKWIWDGKISIIKSSLDKIFLLLFLSVVLSTVFAQDTWMAFWGYDGRLGTGLFVMIFLFLFFFLSRSFLQKKNEIVKAVTSLSMGVFVMIILSILSVLKVDIFGWLPYVNNFFVVGLPLTFSFQEIMLISGISVLFNLFLLVSYLQEKKYQGVIFPIIGLLVSFFALTLFSVNQGALVPVLFFVVLIPVCTYLWFKQKKGLRAIPILLFFFALLSAGLSVGFQYKSFIKSILGDTFSTINPIRLGSDISWAVASSSIVNDFFRGLVGLGNDSFGIAYNLFKPSTTAIITLGNTTFVSGSNEIFTILANRGLIGVTVWVILGISYLRLVIKQITLFRKEGNSLSFILTLTSLLIFLGSIFLPFSFLTYFLLFIVTLLSTVFDNKDDNNEEFLVKFWAVNVGKVTKDINKTIESINWVLTVFVTILTTAGIIFLFVKTMSTAYVVRAESYNIEMSNKYQNEPDVDLDIKEDYLERMVDYYSKALKYDSSDPYVNRKSALVSTEIIKLLSERYNKAEEEEKDAILSSITSWKNTSLDLSREAVNISPLTYANWNARASVYIGLISVGLSDYSEDALNALQSCIDLNPLDYDSYYKAGQIYMVKENYEKALSAFSAVLNINGQHVPSLVLSASILNENGDKESSIAYLEAAKKVLENNKLDSGEIYDNIIESLKELGAGSEVEQIEDLEESVVEDTTQLSE